MSSEYDSPMPEIPEKGPVTTEMLGPREGCSRWDHRGYSGREHWASLRPGIELSAATCSWERPLSICIDHPPSALDFCATRGSTIRATADTGETYAFGGGLFAVGQVKHRHSLRFDTPAGARTESVSLSIGEPRLTELLGSSDLPSALRRVLATPGPHPRCAQPMTPDLFDVFDEILYCDVKGPARRLYLESKVLELLSRMIDRLEETERASSPRLYQADVDRLERSRQLLLARLQAPPTLPELARQAGLNEAKLKAGFRSLFGTSVFAYLRAQRMREARRLLRAREGNVSEIAYRVGYANPSKFATAFRKHFGVAPSEV